MGWFKETPEKRIGREFAWGVWEVLCTIACVAILLTMVFNWFFSPPKDNTDPQDGRSGLTLYTDALTGVQYLEGKHGMVVRVDKDGNPVVVGADDDR